jgi:short-subunit dehydrogenase
VRAELRGTGVEVSVVMPGIVRTELAAGLHDSKAVKSVSPEEVAAEVLGALRKPRFDVFVPRSSGALIGSTNFVPRRVREGIARALGSDDALLKTDRAQRREYEARAAASAPAAEDREQIPS